MNRLLVIGYVWPEPASSAAGRHMLSLLRLFVSHGWQVAFATPAQPTAHQVDLASEGVSAKAIALNCDSFDRYISEYQPDIVLFDRFMMEEQFGWRVEKCCPNALKILDTEDLQCLRQARHKAHKAGRDLNLSDLYSDIAKREIAAILRCDLSLIISSYEMELLVKQFKVAPELLLHLPFMVDLSSLEQSQPAFSERQHFVTIGSFRHAPNWDAVLYLQQLWPQIRRKLPKAELHIYGSYPPPKATALNNPKAGFYIKGWADDAKQVMAQARVCLVPLRFGAGIKGKLLEAMECQTPSVTTKIGAEGMHQQEPWPGAIAKDAENFVQTAVTLYQDPERWQSAVAQIHPLLATHYDGQRLGERLMNRVSELQQTLEQHRLNNFTGAMLKHHTMASTRYMSQWIAAKNKQD